MLEVKDLVVRYGGITAVDGVSLRVEEHETVALIGANGAGKTTTLHTISGLLKPASGQVLFQNGDITKVPAESIVARGIVQVPEGRQIFAKLTVEENLRLGAYLRRTRPGLPRTMKKSCTLR